jgi:hypothetical protein
MRAAPERVPLFLMAAASLHNPVFTRNPPISVAHVLYLFYIDQASARRARMVKAAG